MKEVVDNQQVNSALTWLFEKYLLDPAKIWNLSEHAGLHLAGTEGLHELGRFLTQKGFVKNQEFAADGFLCAITMLGVSQVSDTLNEVRYKVLEASIERKQRSILEILEIGPQHIKRGHDYATYLKRAGIIECIFHQHDILAEPTFYGKEWYEANKNRLIN